jgi:PPP family 3-phenylpropionic acid transporter
LEGFVGFFILSVQKFCRFVYSYPPAVRRNIITAIPFAPLKGPQFPMPIIRNRIRHAMRQPITVIRIFFFVWFAGGSFLQPFLPIFYREQELSGLQIGLLSSTGFAVGMLAAPLWGRRADRSPAPHRWLQILMLANLATILVLARQTQFLPMVLIVALNALVASGQEPVSSTLAVRATRGTGSGFGSIRLWGSLGWAIMVLVAGWLIQRTSIYTSFYGYTFFLVSGCIVLFFLRTKPASSPMPRQAAEVERKGEVPLYRNRPLIILFLAMLLAWAAVAGIRQFETIYLKQLGAGEQLIGFAATLAALVELPGMVLADRLTRRYGARWVLIGGLILDGIVRGSVLLLPTVPMLVGIRLLTGISFSLSTVGVIAYVQETTPPDRQTGAIALYTVVVRNLVFLVVAPISGVMFDTIGAYWLYAIALAGNLAAGGLLFLTGKTVSSSQPETAAIA